MSDPKTPALTKEDLAFFIKSLWSALLAPSWTRDGIIDFGKSVFAKTSLSALDDKKFGQLLPQLTTMAESMAASMSSQINAITEPLIATLKEASQKNEELTKLVEELKLKLSCSYGQEATKPETSEKPEIAE